MEDSNSNLDLEFKYEILDSPLNPVCLDDVDVLEGEPSAKAVKSDDAKPPINLWNNQVVTKLKEHWDCFPREEDYSGLRNLDLSFGSNERVEIDRWLKV